MEVLPHPPDPRSVIRSNGKAFESMTVEVLAASGEEDAPHASEMIRGGEDLCQCAYSQSEKPRVPHAKAAGSSPNGGSSCKAYKRSRGSLPHGRWHQQQQRQKEPLLQRKDALWATLAVLATEADPAAISPAAASRALRATAAAAVNGGVQFLNHLCALSPGTLLQHTQQHYAGAEIARHQDAGGAAAHSSQ
ncbi:hypothetical protein cyc_03333 [Cyclospora cayetanensis]|uniref:Uncharacterized protein n=1 Tax=Cyclospora cayetanensis TaxID=88456 RepID=A0A1D3D6R2_9EIME|nr:hypothetical protein cyc_03333 [Cyclospora cayetanensis]